MFDKNNLHVTKAVFAIMTPQFTCHVLATSKRVYKNMPCAGHHLPSLIKIAPSLTAKEHITKHLLDIPICSQVATVMRLFDYTTQQHQLQ